MAMTFEDWLLDPTGEVQRLFKECEAIIADDRRFGIYGSSEGDVIRRIWKDTTA
jgi:hypothetical protein